MAEIVLINPRFEASYWGMEHALPVFGVSAVLPVAALPLLAALTPAEHSITLIDENVEPIDFDRVSRADIVGVTGMVVQRRRMREILTELKRRGAFTVVGGPWITVREEYFGELADVRFIGEAERTWPRFLEEWAAGAHQARYEQSERTDMGTVPTPRFDLLRMDRYAFGSIQISRGCPYTCEFCDIIVVFGRKPRLKTSAQVIAELEALLAQGRADAFIVDDNLIGNKKEIKEILKDVAAWQRERGYPMGFFTEASLDLADDEELMRLMVEANIGLVFVGIESPNETALRETKKLQNLRPSGGGLLDKIHRIQAADIEVWMGMIVGFDSDDASIFEAQRGFVGESRVINVMLGMLSAIPKTPLYQRLAEAGRLDPADEPVFGSNVIPLRMSREELRDGYLSLLRDMHEPDAYFGRLDALILRTRLQPLRVRMEYLRARPWRRFQYGLKVFLQTAVIFQRLMGLVDDPLLRREYRCRMAGILLRRPEPLVVRIYAIKCAMHYHAHTMVKNMLDKGRPITNTY